MRHASVMHGVSIQVGDIPEMSSSDVDPSSSEQSCDTVIYLGPSMDDATDGEHPPVYLPVLERQVSYRMLPLISTCSQSIIASEHGSLANYTSPKIHSSS